MTYSNIWYLFPSSSTRAYMLSAIMLAEYYLISTSSKFTSYCCVLRRLTFYIVRSCLMRVSGTHNSKSVSSAILFPTAYSALITGYSYLISFNGVLDVFQISPFNENFLRFCHLPHVFIDVLDSDVHIIAANNMDIFPVVNDLLQYMISVSIIIYPCIYALSNYVSWILFDFYIIKIHLILLCVEYYVGVRNLYQVTICATLVLIQGPPELRLSIQK